MLDFAKMRNCWISATFFGPLSSRSSEPSRFVVGRPATKRAPRVAVTTRASMAAVAVFATTLASSWNRAWTRLLDTYWATNTMTSDASRLTVAVRSTRTRSKLGGVRRRSIGSRSVSVPPQSPEMIFCPSGLFTKSTSALIAGFTFVGSAFVVM